MSLIQLPPKVVDLVWTPDGDNFVAPCTKAWLVLAVPARMGDLWEMGFTTHTDQRPGGRGFVVTWNPAKARKGYEADLAMLEGLYAEDIGYAKAQQQALDEIALKRQLEKASGEIEYRRERARRRDQQVALVANFAGLLDPKDLDFIKHLINTHATYDAETRRVERIADRLDRKVQEFFEKRAGAGVLWSDDKVMAATKHMTSLDLDEARASNGEGWNGADSRWGHWATKAFCGPQHDLAVRVARVLCAGYFNTQLRGFEA